MIKKIHACNRMNFCSNVNEVIRAVLNSLFFLQKDFARTKITKSTKSTESTKSTKVQRRKQAKAQNATREQKLKSALKKHLSGKRSLIRLFAFLCFLCARRKENRKKRKKPQCKCTKYRCPHN